MHDQTQGTPQHNTRSASGSLLSSLEQKKYLQILEEIILKMLEQHPSVYSKGFLPETHRKAEQREKSILVSMRELQDWSNQKKLEATKKGISKSARKQTHKPITTRLGLLHLELKIIRTWMNTTPLEIPNASRRSPVQIDHIYFLLSLVDRATQTFGKAFPLSEAERIILNQISLDCSKKPTIP